VPSRSGNEGITWSVAHTYVRNRVIRSAEYPRGLGFGPFVNISQHRIEQVLVEAAEAIRSAICVGARRLLRWLRTPAA